MGRHHQGSRRRAYGRRQHELRERTDRSRDLLGLRRDPAAASVVATWRPGLSPRAFPAGLLPARGTD